MKSNFLNSFINLLQCPICGGQLKNEEKFLLNCIKCNYKYKIHKNNVMKLFTPENIYPTKKKINWKNIYE